MHLAIGHIHDFHLFFHLKIWCWTHNYKSWYGMLPFGSGSIRACKNAALKCEESKFEQYKLMLGDRFSSDHTHRMNTYLDRIKVLEHWISGLRGVSHWDFSIFLQLVCVQSQVACNYWLNFNLTNHSVCVCYLREFSAPSFHRRCGSCLVCALTYQFLWSDIT